MIYLKNVVYRITDSKEILESAKLMKTDEEILNFLKEMEFQFDDIVKALEKHYGIKYVNLSSMDIDKNIISKFDLDSLEKQLVFPYKVDEPNKIYYFAINDITNQNLVNRLSESCRLMGYKQSLSFSFEHEILNSYKKINAKNAFVIDDSFDVQTWTNNIINEGVRINASDIHIEKLEEFLQVRYRIDGILTNKKVFNFDDATISSICVRIKIISSMDISEKRKSQDGRVDNYMVNGEVFDIRVSSVCTIFGEKFVMRLIPKSAGTRTFEELGFSESNKLAVVRMLKNKNGIIYLAGATGSGKSTTLYTMIEQINSDDINIYTIEDPVEKTVDNVNQIQVNPPAGINYASVLKSLLRQDPDVIVVGEVRDNETASLSVRASLTGHLVLTTVHANNALDSVGRLIDMDIEAYLLSASTVGFLSQRLSRKLCPHCKQKVEHLKSYERAWLNKVCNEYNLPHYDDNNFYKAVGCEHCTGGYKGRVAVVEVLEMSDRLKNSITSEVDLSIIRQQAIEDGFKPLSIDGVEKALSGITTIDELIRQLN